MIEWLTDTLVMTGALMALVLLVRRPVSRWFGPAAAYALWALPVLRLVLPPLALPRSIFARPEVSIETVTAAAQPMMPAPVTDPAATMLDMPVSDATTGSVDPGLLTQIPWVSLLLTIWLTGAAIFLVQRFRNYRLMRAELLIDARQVAHAGDIRIVETPAAAAPLAFGVRDRIVALPEGFLATVDSESSDFAIAHELEHHAGNDLLALMVLQPLFALHWFNPLGWAAWRALRADQEAACDARVMAGCDREVRARYGRVIASFTAGTRLTLAAPIAGALAGEKPIIQRLRALSTMDVSPTRRVMARSLFAFAVVAVPCTATVTYAAMDDQDVPVVPEAPTEALYVPGDAPAPAIPAAPAVPSSHEAEAWPVPPEPPQPPAPQTMSVPEAPPVPWSAATAPQQFGGLGVPPAPPAPPPTPVPPAPPAPPSHESMDAVRRAATRDYRAAMAERMRNVPVVEQTTSADGRIQTIRILHKTEGGRRQVQKTITIDSTCPADRKPASGGNPEATSKHVCTGAPRQAMNAAIQAMSSARASVASNRALDAMVRDQIVAELDKEMAATRAGMIGEAD